MNIHLDLKDNSYDIIVERGILEKAGEHINLNRRVLVVTDSGVPTIYAQTLAKHCKSPIICTVESGEASKSIETFTKLLRIMLDNDFSRKDCVVAVGGGVVGDLGGFVASLYMRGVDFYNVPTTVLSQVDSSIGGKTAVNLAGIKNIIGAFYQPKAVLVDPDTLQTLPKRQIVNGLMEAIKMGATSDKKLFDLFLEEEWEENLDLIIEKALLVKKLVVEQDEKESHLRKILNYGHTIGHGFESAAYGRYLHGECVALGMLYMSSEEVQDQLCEIYEKLEFDLPEFYTFDMEAVKEAITHDKKANHDTCSVVFVSEIGNGAIEEWSMEQVLDRLECE